MFCIKCGEKLNDDAKFCIKCGTKVEKVEESVTVKKENVKKVDNIKVESVNQNVLPNSQVKDNSGKTALIIVLSIVGGLVVIGVIVFLVLWMFIFRKGSDKLRELKPEEKQEEKIVEPIKKEKSDVKISLYKMDGNDYIFGYNSNEYKENYYEKNNDYELVGEYECYSESCKYKDGAVNQILVYDDDYILYDVEKDKETVVDLDIDSNNDTRFVIYDNKTYGIQVGKYDKYAYFDLKENKYITDFIYSGFNSDGALKFNKVIGYKISDTDDMGMYSKSNYYLIDTKSGKIVHEENDLNSFQAKELNKHIYYTKLVYTNTFDNGYDIYNDKFELLFENIDQYGLLDNGNIMIKNNKNGFNIYNSNGTLIKESKEYTEVKLIVDNYVAVIDNGYLKLIDSNEKEVAKFTEWNNNLRFHELISGYFTDFTSKVHGVYLVVEDESIPEGTKGRGKEYYYGTETGQVGVIEIEYVGGYAKPVLYLYPEEKTNVEVSFENPNMLTTTYPKYINKWNVLALPNGDLYDNKGRYYYGLYWEEVKNHNIDFNEGFYVTKDNAINFLEEKLEILGFNNREANEFIMYWLPILESNEQSLVYFELTDEREAYNKLNIKPVPDSILRVAIHVKKVNGKVDIKEQKLDTFNRYGFSAIEWGGVIH